MNDQETNELASAYIAGVVNELETLWCAIGFSAYPYCKDGCSFEDSLRAGGGHDLVLNLAKLVKVLAVHDPDVADTFAKEAETQLMAVPESQDIKDDVIKAMQKVITYGERVN